MTDRPDIRSIRINDQYFEFRPSEIGYVILGLLENAQRERDVSGPHDSVEVEALVADARSWSPDQVRRYSEKAHAMINALADAIDPKPDVSGWKREFVEEWIASEPAPPGPWVRPRDPEPDVSGSHDSEEASRG